MDDRPRLLHLHSSFDLGGKEARAVQLMNQWGNRARHGIVSGVSGAMSAREAIAPDLEVDFPEAPALQGRPSIARFRDLARFMCNYDLVLTYNWGSMDAVMAHRLFARTMRLPPLIHHEDGFSSDEANSLKFTRNLYRRIALARADALVVPSTVLERIALRQWHQPRARVHIISNGIDVDRYATTPQPDALPGFTPTPGKVVVGTLAGLRTVKNIPRLVRAVATHRDRLQLVIVGEGPEHETIQREAARLGLNDMHMAGFQSEPWRFMGLFDIFALSSDSEQFPISLVEAMAAGLPVASTDVGDVAAMVSPENLPFVVPDEAALCAALGRLADDPGLRKSVGAGNRIRAQALYGQDAMFDVYGRLYGTALARPNVLR
ncbi:glycosyl transferase family 1 [Sphingobium sp. SCG-1]|uniref:glycosyltransferase n=1 Tax=Sphingobium sp. SCG-1 TaxID=2072936 RepID=UPI000CD67CE4|nr:glycosyltransferase [Sphingobium sp. SCG-1]AUW58385.1 glycosyl transferase family 1 [Sphingobium sp. SCG-1]